MIKKSTEIINNTQTVNNEEQNNISEKSKKVDINKKLAVYMNEVTSMEYYLYEDKTMVPILKDISIEIEQNEIWGIVGEDDYELKLLLEIMANVKPYERGKCILNNRGMMRRKRIILDHMFYIGDCDMLYRNMNVLECLMFATDKSSEKAIDRQDRFLDILEDVGLADICLTVINYLSAEERAVVTLLLAAFSNSQLIIFNLPEVNFNKKLINIINKIVQIIKSSGKAFVTCSKNSGYIQSVCEKAAFIKGSTLVYNDYIFELMDQMDNRIYIITADDTKKIYDDLKASFSEFTFEIKDKNIYVYNEKDISVNSNNFYRIFSKYGDKIEKIERSKKSLTNVYEKVMAKNDL